MRLFPLRVWYIGAVAVGLAHTCACATPVAQRILHSEVGSTFLVAFDSNKTTGYEWMLSVPVDRTMVEMIDEKFLKDPALPAIGRPGKQQWTFKALKAGKTVLVFKHARPWQENISTAPTVEFMVLIEDKK